MGVGRAVLIPPPRDQVTRDQVTQGPPSSPHGGALPSPTLRRRGASDSQHGAHPHLPWPNRLGDQAQPGAGCLWAQNTPPLV